MKKSLKSTRMRLFRALIRVTLMCAAWWPQQTRFCRCYWTLQAVAYQLSGCLVVFPTQPPAVDWICINSHCTAYVKNQPAVLQPVVRTTTSLALTHFPSSPPETAQPVSSLPNAHKQSWPPAVHHINHHHCFAATTKRSITAPSSSCPQCC